MTIGTGELLDLSRIPRGVEVLAHHHRHVPADPLHLLDIPEGEGIVVPVGEDHPVRLHAHQEVVRPVPGGVVAGPAGPGPVQPQGHEGQQKNGGHQDLPPGPGKGVREPLPECGEAQSRQHAPEPEAGDEEVVPLTDLVELPGLDVGSQGVAILEVQVDHQPQGDRESQGNKEVESLPVPLPRHPEPPKPQKEKEKCEGGASAPRQLRGVHPPTPLPVEVLVIVQKLVPDGSLPLREGRLLVLEAGQDKGKVLASGPPVAVDGHRRRGEGLAGRIPLVDDRPLSRTDGQEEVEGKTHDHQEDSPNPQVPPQEDRRTHQEHEEGKSRGRENRHEVVRRPQGHEVHRRQEIPASGLLVLEVPPSEGQPHHGHHDGDAEGVDFLVHRGLVPDGEGRGGKEDRRSGPQEGDPLGGLPPRAILVRRVPVLRRLLPMKRRLPGSPDRPPLERDSLPADKPPQNPMGHEEVESCGRCAGGRSEKIDSHGHRKAQGRQEQAPGLAQHYEEGVTRRMRNSKDVGRGDVLAGIPHGG